MSYALTISSHHISALMMPVARGRPMGLSGPEEIRIKALKTHRLDHKVTVNFQASQIEGFREIWDERVAWTSRLKCRCALLLLYATPRCCMSNFAKSFPSPPILMDSLSLNPPQACKLLVVLISGYRGNYIYMDCQLHIVHIVHIKLEYVLLLTCALRRES